MSAQAMGHVFAHHAYGGGSATAMVLLAVADVANDLNGHEVWLSRAALAAKAKVCPRTVRRACAQLVEDGWLVLLDGGGQGAGNTVRYRFVFKGDGTQSDKGDNVSPMELYKGDSVSGIRGTTTTNKGDTRVPQYQRTQGELQTLRDVTESARTDRTRGFADFWKVFPARNGRKIGKAKAAERWAKLDLADRRNAFRGAQRLARAVHDDGRLPPDAWRWLRDRTWVDWLDDDHTPANVCNACGIADDLHDDDGCTADVTPVRTASEIPATEPADWTPPPADLVARIRGTSGGAA